MQPPMLLLIEFNELCPTLLDRFMGQSLLPNFRRFHDSSTVFITDADEDPPNLEPWIQWPTVHSGLPYSEHRVFHLGDGRRLEHKCVAELLSDAGFAVGVCASMNLNYQRLHGYLLSDPWDKDGVSHPDWLTPFYRILARQVQESSREEPLSLPEVFQFGTFLLRNGLTSGTVRAILAQLWSERREPGLRWRRACILDRLLYDVFRCLNRRFDVRFATLFCNSTAHFQHYYWRHMTPEDFDAPVPATDHPSLREAVVYGYRMMDELLGRIMRDYPDAVLMLCSALSQQPWTDTTKCTFRPSHFDTLLEFAGLPAHATTVKPVMAEEFHLECPDDAFAAVAEARFQELMVDDQPLMKVQRDGRNLFAGCRITDAAVLDRPVSRRSDGRRRLFSDLFYMVHTMRSGRHHPDGVFWVRDGVHRTVPRRVPLTAVAPTILAHFGVPQPAAMLEKPLLWGLGTGPHLAPTGSLSPNY
jgi:hypothetical protein